MSSLEIETLLAWCNQNDIQIDPRIQVVERRNRGLANCTYPQHHGISVYSLEDHIDCSCVREYSISSSVAIQRGAVNIENKVDTVLAQDGLFLFQRFRFQGSPF